MRTYQSTPKDKKVQKNKKAVYGILLAITVVVVAAIIALSLTLGKPATDDGLQVPPDDIPAGVQPQVFTLPMEEFEAGREAVLDRLVWNSTMAHFRTHNGMDFLAAQGAEVRAITGGTVLSVTHTQLQASVVKIQHEDGFVSTYMGLDTDIAVEAGDVVKGGDTIGVLAASMPYERSVGPHLHLEMELNNQLVNPLSYLPDLGEK
jgi:murein DD-endopeptidase MepM/ murein hydrolase activator NlpD